MLHPLAFAASRRSLCALLCLLCVSLLALSAPRSACAQAEPTLDSGAKIHVTVAGEPDISGDYTVDSGGNITLLYINQVHVAGLTAAQTATKLAGKDELGKYYRSPQVIVTLIQAGGVSVELTGAVATQGPRIVRSDTHLNEVMQQAGPALDADLAGVQITHGTPGKSHTTDTVNYLAFLNNKDAAGDPLLQDGDVIYVPRKTNVPIEINVRGEVAKPGRMSVPAKTTVYDAIQTAGGLLQDANRRGIYLQHASTTDQVPIDYDLASRQADNPQSNPLLLDGDTIVVKTADVPNVYTITGAIRNPAEYPLTNPNFTLADAIGKAGGLADRPKLKEVTITRTPPGGRAQVIKLDASDPAVQGNTLVQPGDNIQIPQGTPGARYDPLTIVGVLVSVFAIFRH